MLKGQDILTTLLIASNSSKIWTQPEIAATLGISLGEVNNALKRGYQSGILRRRKSRYSTEKLLLKLRKLNNTNPNDTSELLDEGAVSGYTPVVSAIEELIIHGLKYFFPPVWGEVTRGIPTAYGTPELSKMIENSDPPPVWVYPKGNVRGLSLEPIHENVPSASMVNPTLYELLALTDVFRIGRSREISLARDLLRQRLRGEQ